MIKYLNSFLLIIFLIILGEPARPQMLNDDVYKIIKVMDIIKTFYVDTVNRPKLVEKAIVEMLKELDPHSVYISKDEVKEMNEPLEGSFEGVGVQFNIKDDTVLIVGVIAGGPSERVGIKAGDRIMKVDGKPMAGIGIKNKDVFSLLRGKKGTKVNVSILRPEEKNLLDFTIVRDKIPLFSIDAVYMVSPNTGYIKISRFAATTMDEYREAIKKLKARKATNLILDLSGNGGGYLNIAVELADDFLDNRKLVVYTEGNAKPRENYTAVRKGEFETGRVVVMIDEASASASEIVTGAIQDWDRGVVVGRRSFGKGLVQRQFQLPDSSQMRLTIARYYTPTGRCIQKPYDKGNEDYNEDLIKRIKHGELSNADSIKFPDSLKYQTLMMKRTVYGGGGIMPDVFVPIDTLGYSDYYKKLIRKGVFGSFALDYVDKNRNKLNEKFKNDFQKFKAEFNIDQPFIDEFVTYAVKEGVPADSAGLQTSYRQITTILKGQVARDLFNSSEFFEIINPLDPIYKEACNIIASPRYETLLTEKK